MRNRTATRLFLALGLSAAAGGCGSSEGVPLPAPAPVTCSGSTPTALTVKNYLAKCSVSVAGHAASSLTSQTFCVAAGAAPLSATALAGFQLGPTPWHGTDGDHGSGDPGTVSGSGQSATSDTTITVSGARGCAWVCCPFPDGTGCPTTDQCP